MMKTILHLCADTGSDSWPYQLDPSYEVIKIGSSIGVENYAPDRDIHGIIANPVCTNFSNVRRGKPGENYPHVSDVEQGMKMVRECLRVIDEANPKWWVMENPATGSLKKQIGAPKNVYHPWHYGSPWSKLTGLWGDFTMPKREYYFWDEVPNKLPLWTRPGRRIPSFAYLHKNDFYSIAEFRESGITAPETDSEFRSLCSQKFARAFKAVNP